MRRALDLSAQHQPHPNPRVGAVVVAGDAIVGEGAHAHAGGPHAEVVALEAAGEEAFGATVYVTLEPCSHHGRTPPCADALIAAGVARVVVGSIDPDARVSGTGVDALRQAGIEVATGLLADAVEAGDPGYFHHRRTGRPLITLKLATTLDGMIAAADRTSKWITGEEARIDGHRLRRDSDVVIVGAGTLIDDDPRLDVRLDGYSGKQPRPVVIAGTRPLDPAAAIFSRDPLVYTSRPLDLTAEQVVVAGSDHVDVEAVLDDLGTRGYVSALVEGGATLAGNLVRNGLVDRIVFYLAAKLGAGRGLGAFGGEFATIGEAVPVSIDEVTRVGDDLRVETWIGS
ncbi:MAG: bifunctional diaminohydroxyphosphoribosylaminopyrimidine deaminase/5-amino-6-(5-phosphoribosylamino)uracil reductase RibD [bacterium]|nr:bifunctional diaminohydroxyphosphoribosylaminopyrimidine deaminase/5-amino-6-(5-phosphoribosylamino)uracil reductase RibD [bacterium]